MGSATLWTPRAVPRVESRFRRIATDFPVPESIPILEALEKYELRAMGGQPPVVWDRAEGFQVYDRWGNKWLDWSSGVLITNAGHGRQEIVDAIKRQADAHLLANYAFPSELRAELCRRLVELMPEPLRKIFLLTTGSEAVEFAIKVARTHGQKVGGRNKRVIVSYEKAFHGRTLGSQLAGGIPALKEWIGAPDATFVQVPFPDGYWTEDTSFELFEKALGEHGVAASDVCGVLMETYQGGTAAFAPPEYVRTLRDWCTAQRAVLVFDEVQAGFGRTGKMWGFEHYGVVPDLTTWGKGISSSLPIAAVVGRADLMDLHPPGSASSTHSGNPVSCAAALANLDVILKEDLAGNSARRGAQLHERLAAIEQRHAELGGLAGKGLVAGLACVQPGKGHAPDGELARSVVMRCVEKGLLMFNPVGPMGCTIKICPPLTITPDAVEEGCAVLAESVEEVLRERMPR
ncbi:MAG: aminotransferase class III-fold pyridoxal phosphate-dependent enzyme [Bryobacteraceae bacterium]|nr:aminotransferase class III-fold pyridoxal phosphate-dependent enzyme [Bryobacteraceae bacterium]